MSPYVVTGLGIVAPSVEQEGEYVAITRDARQAHFATIEDAQTWLASTR